MSALRAVSQPSTFASQYLGSLFEEPSPRVPKSIPTDPAAKQFFAEVGERIKDAREAKGWRREDLAHHMGIGFRSVQNYEQGDVTLTRISQLAEVLGVQPRWLLHGDRALEEQVSELLALVHHLADRLDRVSPQSAEV